MEIKKENLSYSQVKNNNFSYDDKYGIMSYALSHSRKSAFFSNPNQVDNENIMLRLYLDENTVIARSMSFRTKIRVNGTLYYARSGSSMYVQESYRHLGIGAELMYEVVKNKSNKFCLCAGLSEMVLPMYKALKYIIFSFPICCKIVHTKPFLRNRNLPKFVVFFVSPILDFVLRLYSVHNVFSRSRYTAVRVNKVPDWVDDITLHDKYEYMEIHDHKWLQWNLDHNFHDSPDNIQAFYVIKNENVEVGFFMITERNEAGIITGKIVEWGIKEGLLLEEDLINIAIKQFSKKVDVIKILVQSEYIRTNLKSKGFKVNDHFEIAFKDLTKGDNDYRNVKKWRIRYGYADTIMSK